MRTPPPSGPSPRRSKVQSVEVGLSILTALVQLDGVASLSSLAASTGIAAPKLHRYLASLAVGGFVGQEEASGHYRLGLASMMIGLAALRSNDPVRLASARLAGLRDAVGATCFVAVPANLGPTVLAVAEAPGAVIVNVRLGSTLPADASATGRVLAAYAGTHRRGAGIRAAGSASVVDSLLVGVSAVSAAVRNDLGVPVAAITALGPTGTIDVSQAGLVGRAIRDAARAVSTSLGLPPDLEDAVRIT